MQLSFGEGGINLKMHDSYESLNIVATVHPAFPGSGTRETYGFKKPLQTASPTPSWAKGRQLVSFIQGYTMTTSLAQGYMVTTSLETRGSKDRPLGLKQHIPLGLQEWGGLSDLLSPVVCHIPRQAGFWTK